MKFTVFGCSGFIGSHLVEYLQKKGHDVLKPARDEFSSLPLNLGNVVYAIGLVGHFRKFPYDTIDAHVNVLNQLLKSFRYDSLLYLSSTRIYQSSGVDTYEDAHIKLMPGKDGIYDISKLLGESLCLAEGKSTVRIARLSNVYGREQSSHTFLGSLIADLRSNKDIIIRETEDSSKDYISIFDVVKLIEKISIEGKSQIYNVASGINTEHRIIANLLQASSFGKVCFSDDAERRRLAPINAQRIKAEFGFQPSSLEKDFNELL